jgi:hypothetical protein
MSLVEVTSGRIKISLSLLIVCGSMALRIAACDNGEYDGLFKGVPELKNEQTV